MKNSIAAALVSFALTGCLGYHIGPAKPYYLRDVRTIAVPTFTNTTLIPRVEVLVSDTVIKQFQQDGTFQITGGDQADVTLKGEITSISLSPARSVRGNVLATAEFNLTMRVRYKVIGRDGKPLVPPNEAVGTTSFFVGTDVTTDERQALPLAAEELANNLVVQLSEGW